MAMGRWAQLALGTLLGLFGFVMVVGGLLSLSEAEDSAAHLAATLLLGLGPLLAGAWLGWRVLAARSRGRREALERALLRLAERSDGRLRPPIVARETRLTLDEAKAELDRLHLAGYCQTELEADGTLVYRFD